MKVHIENHHGAIRLSAIPQSPTLLSPLRLEVRREHVADVLGVLTLAASSGDGFKEVLELVEPDGT